jgi:SAM-dependent MidA family methyltransferase
VHWNNQRGFHHVFGDLSPQVRALSPVEYLKRVGVEVDALPEGALLEVSPATGEWVREFAARLQRGYAILIDYGYPASELYRDHRLESTLRVHARHEVTANPYEGVGERDLTAHVDFSAMIEVAEDAGLDVVGLATQADFLTGAGMGGLLIDLQQQPEMGLDEYYRAQSAVFRLIDPGGMGRFRVLGLSRGMTDDVPLMGFAGPDLPESLRI